MNLIIQAKANKEIAWELHLTEGTIKEYLNRTFRKLALKNRTDLAVWALTKQAEIGLGSAPLLSPLAPEGDVERVS